MPVLVVRRVELIPNPETSRGRAKPVSGLGNSSRLGVETPRAEPVSYLRLIDSRITQLKAQGPSRTCNESKEEEEEEPVATRVGNTSHHEDFSSLTPRPSTSNVM